MSNQLPLHRRDINANIPYLDGVRGLAIFLVATGHIFNEIYVFKITWVGLNLFFILSGYLITGCLFRYQSHSVANYFRNFYGRRVLRIFPLYYGALIFVFFILPFISQHVSGYYAELKDNQSYYWLYASNWNMVWNGLPHQPVFFHFWSLAVEEQFYLIWPMLFLIFRKTSARTVLIVALLALSIFSRIMTDDSLQAYLSSLTAAEPLLLGCLLCILEKNGWLMKLSRGLNILAGAAILFLCVVFARNGDLHITNTLLMKYGYSAIDIIWCAVLCMAVCGLRAGSKVRQFFSATSLQWLGKYSYSIYVFHWIILQLFIFKLQAMISGRLPEVLVYLLPRLAGMGLTVLVSYFSYNYFEKRFLHLKKYFSDDSRWGWNIGRTIVFKKRRAINTSVLSND